MAVTREISNKIQIQGGKHFHAKSISTLRPRMASGLPQCRFAGRMKDVDGSIYMGAYVVQLAPTKYI
jgi:hypothetical protein